LLANNPAPLQPKLFSNKQLLTLILPLVIERILNVSVGFADTIMIASVGEAAVSSIALVDSINNLFLFLFSSLAAGGAVVVAQYIGQHNSAKADDAAKQLIYSTTFVALVFMATFLIFNHNILRALYGDLDPQVMNQAQTYFALTAISYPLLGLFNSGAALFRAMGNSRISMRVSFVMAITNIAGNILFIYVAKMGVLGAGIATLIARFLSAILMLFLLVKNGDPIRITNLHRIHFNWPMIRRILNIGIPNGIESGIFHIGKILVLSLIATFGTTAIAANAIANALSSVTNIPGGAMGTATLTVVGQSMGAGEVDQASYYARKLMKITYITLAILATTLFFSTELLVGLFNLSAAATNLAVKILKLLFIMNGLLWPLAFALPQVLRASGDVRFTMTVSIASMWIFRIGFSYLLGRHFGLGLQGIWIAMYIDWVCRATCFVIRFLKGTWKEKTVI
jgi:putative MATE family efflux protein